MKTYKDSRKNRSKIRNKQCGTVHFVHTFKTKAKQLHVILSVLFNVKIEKEKQTDKFKTERIELNLIIRYKVTPIT